MVPHWHTPLLDLQEILGSLSTDYFTTLLTEAVTAKRTAEAMRQEAEAAHRRANLLPKLKLAYCSPDSGAKKFRV